MGLETLPKVIDVIIDRKLSEMHTCLPGRVVKYDFEKQMASVQPMIKKSYIDGKTESLPIIVNVPVVWPRASKCSLTFPLLENDYVLLLFSERAMELFLKQGGEQEPGDRRKFDLTDAIAIPGVYPFTDKDKSLVDNNEDVLLVYDETSIRMKKEGDLEIKVHKDHSLDIEGDSDINIQGNATVTVVGNVTLTVTGNTHINSNIFVSGDIEVTGDVNVTGDVVTGFGLENVSSATHTHGGVTAGPDHTAPPDDGP